jgi:hypothetical protein
VVGRGREETPLRLAFRAREGWVAMVVVMVVVAKSYVSNKKQEKSKKNHVLKVQTTTICGRLGSFSSTPTCFHRNSVNTKG